MTMARLIEYDEASAEIRAVYDDIMTTRGTDWINNFWKALANHPPTLRRTWESVKEVMAPGVLHPLTKELLYLAVSASNGDEIDIAFRKCVSEQTDALLVAPDVYLGSRRVQIAILAAHYSVPTIYTLRNYPEAGGLISYGTNSADAIRQAGIYVGRILKGAKPADLPVEQSTKFELVINLRTAKALGLEIPPPLLARADEVIE